MRRRAVLTLLALGAGLGPSVLAGAQQGIELRIVGRPRGGEARFRLVNRSGSTLRFETYDRGHVHNGLERREASGAWSDASLGYCGLGQDAVVEVRSGAAQSVNAYVGSAAGTYRIRLQVDQVDASGGSVSIELVSTGSFVVA